MSKQIEITNTYKGNSTQITYKQDEQGRWMEFSRFCPEGRYTYESDVIDAVRKYDRANLNKHFPMAGFHS